MKSWKMLLFAAMFAMAVAFVAILPGKEADAASFTTVTASSQVSVSTSSAVYYKVTVPTSYYVDKTYISTEVSALTLKWNQKGGDPVATRVNSSGVESGGAFPLDSGYDCIKAAAESTVYFKVTGGLGSKFTICVYPYPSNDTQDHANAIADDTSIVDFGGLTTCQSKYEFGYQYYYIDATEKAKYKVGSDDFVVYVKNGLEGYERIEKGYTNTYTVDAGTRLYLQMISDRKLGEMTVKRDIFNRMTSMEFSESSYTVSPGETAEMKLNFVKRDANRTVESTIVSKGLYASYGNCLAYPEQVDISTYKVSYNQPGIYTVKLENSEGLTATTKLIVVPDKPNVSGYTATGTTTSSTVSIFNTLGDCNGLAIYVKTSSGYKYEGLMKHYTSGYNKYTVKGLKPNKTYYVKVRAYAGGGSNTAYSAYSDAMKIITAPSKAPKIKSAKAVKTTYIKAKKIWHSGHYDAGYVWHPGYYTTVSAHSVASVKVSLSKVSGAGYYESPYGKISKNIIAISVGGKAKAQTKKIRVRAVKSSGRATAYGPWSKYKSVKIKAAK